MSLCRLEAVARIPRPKDEDVSIPDYFERVKR